MQDNPLDAAAARTEEELAQLLSDISAELRLHDIPPRLRELALRLEAALEAREDSATEIAAERREPDATDR